MARLIASLVGVLVSAGCYHGSTPAYHATTTDRPVVGQGQQASGKDLARGFPGVIVTRTPRGGVSIRLLSAMVGGGRPLCVIDGTPILGDPDRGFDWLKPEDIERITALKGPAETAVYGPRGVHGVILITTKQDQTRRKQGH
jgi:TonB-dependent SusC/RagA subfamily outer membrane receptor